MRVKLDFDTTTCDLLEVDLVELSVLHDALATLLETAYPKVAEALSEGVEIDDALESLNETDAFRVRVIVERLYDKLEKPLTLLEDVLTVEDGEGDRVRIVLESEQEASALHQAAKELGEQVGKALDHSELPYPDAAGLVRDFAGWFDPDDIPEYPYFIEMDVRDAEIIAQLAERLNAHQPSEPIEQLMRVMRAAATDEDEPDEGEEDEE